MFLFWRKRSSRVSWLFGSVNSKINLDKGGIDCYLWFMTTKEMLVEIEAIKRRIRMLPEGSAKIGELSMALAALYDSYVAAMERRMAA